MTVGFHVNEAYQQPAGAAGPQCEQPGLMVGDQGSGAGAHARAISSEEPPSARPPPLGARRHEDVVSSPNAAETTSDQVTSGNNNKILQISFINTYLYLLVTAHE